MSSRDITCFAVPPYDVEDLNKNAYGGDSNYDDDNEEPIPLFTGRKDGTIEKFTSVQAIASHVNCNKNNNTNKDTTQYLTQMNMKAVATTRTPCVVLRGHGGSVTGLQAINNHCVYSCSLDGTIREWNTNATLDNIDNDINDEGDDDDHDVSKHNTKNYNHVKNESKDNESIKKNSRNNKSDELATSLNSGSLTSESQADDLPSQRHKHRTRLVRNKYLRHVINVHTPLCCFVVRNSQESESASFKTHSSLREVQQGQQHHNLLEEEEQEEEQNQLHRHIYAGGQNGALYFVDLNTSNGMIRQAIWGEHHERITCMTLSLSLKFLITGSDDHQLRVWEVASGKCLRVLRGHDNQITCVTVLRDKFPTRFRKHNPNSYNEGNDDDDDEEREYGEDNDEDVNVSGEDESNDETSAEKKKCVIVSLALDNTMKVWKLPKKQTNEFEHDNDKLVENKRSGENAQKQNSSFDGLQHVQSDASFSNGNNNKVQLEAVNDNGDVKNNENSHDDVNESSVRHDRLVSFQVPTVDLTVDNTSNNNNNNIEHLQNVQPRLSTVTVGTEDEEEETHQHRQLKSPTVEELQKHATSNDNDDVLFDDTTHNANTNHINNINNNNKDNSDAADTTYEENAEQSETEHNGVAFSVQAILHPIQVAKSALKTQKRHPFVPTSTALATFELPYTPRCIWTFNMNKADPVDSFDDEDENNDDEDVVGENNGNDEAAIRSAARRAYMGMLYIGLGDGRVVGIHSSSLSHTVLKFAKENIIKVRNEVAHAKYIMQEGTRAAMKACKLAIAKEKKRLVKEATKQLKAKKQAERQERLRLRSEKVAARKAARANHRKGKEEEEQEEEEYEEQEEEEEEEEEEEYEDDEEEEEEEEEKGEERKDEVRAERDNDDDDDNDNDNEEENAKHHQNRELKILNDNERNILRTFTEMCIMQRNNKIAMLNSAFERHAKLVMPLAHSHYHCNKKQFAQLPFTTVSMSKNEQYAVSGITAYKGKVYAALGSTVIPMKLYLC